MPIDLKTVQMNRTQPNAQPGLTSGDTSLRAYLRGVYNYMAGGLALTGVIAWAAVQYGLYQQIARTPAIWVVMLAPLAMVMFLSFRIQKMKLATAQATFWAYSAIMGLSLAGIFLIYTRQSIAATFFATAGTFAAMSVYGYTTKTDLTKFGSFLLMGLFGIIIAGLVNFFLKSSALQFAVSVMGVIVFVGLTAYDTQKIKQMHDSADSVEDAGKKTVMGALTLYLDFVNLFLMLLRLFGGRRN